MPRGCGNRLAGAMYWETLLGPQGRGVEQFLLCPPYVPDLAALGIAPIGVSMFERQGVWHILDWIGEAYYPNVADFVEEARVMGVSRRLPLNLDYGRLTPESRLLTIHARAWIDRWEPYVLNNPILCRRDARMMRTPMCCGMWWHDLTNTFPANAAAGTRVARMMPWGSYDGYRRPDEEPGYKPAIFASWPATRIAVVRDPIGTRHTRALQRLQRTGTDLPFSMVEA